MLLIFRFGLLKSYIFSINNRKIDKMMKYFIVLMRVYDKKIYENCKFGFFFQGKKV